MNESLVFLEEQFNSQRIMLEDALFALEEKNKILEKSNYELEEKRFELEQFIYRLNHDFKSPVSTIKGLTDLLEFEEVGTQKIVSKLRDTVLRLETLITNLAYFYVTTQANIDLLPLHKVVLNSISKFSQDFIKFNININYKENSIIRGINVSISDFDAIFGSLISNSIHFCDTNKSEMKIELRVEIIATELVITIIDNGLGIEPIYQKQVFDIFTKASTKSIGSGLGLYIVTKIVKKYDGLIELGSEKGIGTQISIRVPLQKLT